MKQYNSIPHWKKGLFGKHCIAFDKLDGSNLRFEWTRKNFKKNRGYNGWDKFGTRRRLFDKSDDVFGNAIDIFIEKYSEDLNKIFTDNKAYKKIDKFTIFCEYLGDNSFAGHHDPNDNHDVILIDVNPYKRGMLSAKEFVKSFGHVHIPEIIYEGNYNKQLVYDVLDGVYDVDEGIVAKGLNDKGRIWTCKVKTREWLNKVKEKMKGNLKLFNDDFNALKSIEDER